MRREGGGRAGVIPAADERMGPGPQVRVWFSAGIMGCSPCNRTGAECRAG